jgi:hypothetical protein
MKQINGSLKRNYIQNGHDIFAKDRMRQMKGRNINDIKWRRSCRNTFLLLTANCTFYRHIWYAFARLITLVCLSNLLVSQKRGTWYSSTSCYLLVRNNLKRFHFWNSMNNSASSPFIRFASTWPSARKQFARSLDVQC